MTPTRLLIAIVLLILALIHLIYTLTTSKHPPRPTEIHVYQPLPPTDEWETNFTGRDDFQVPKEWQRAMSDPFVTHDDILNAVKPDYSTYSEIPPFTIQERTSRTYENALRQTDSLLNSTEQPRNLPKLSYPSAFD